MLDLIDGIFNQNKLGYLQLINPNYILLVIPCLASSLYYILANIFATSSFKDNMATEHFLFATGGWIQKQVKPQEIF